MKLKVFAAVGLTATALAAVGLGLSRGRTAGDADPCSTRGTLVYVSTAEHALWLCEGGTTRARFRVALGSGGVDKRVQGDRKVPRGTYDLDAPRPSARFGTFIPIAYPTAEQRKLGFTGGDVGIHGPNRRLGWLGRANTWFDWTAGCIALGTQHDLDRVALFVRESSPEVEIR